MVVDIGNDERFPPLGGADMYIYLHLDGVLSTTDAAGKVQQRALPDVIDAVHRAQSAGGTVWISGPDSPLGLAALAAIFDTRPKPLQPWSASAPPVRWPVGGNGFLAAAQLGQNRILDDLCDRGVDLTWRDDEGNTALHSAAYGRNDHAVARLLREGAEVDVRNAAGFTPEMISLAQGTDAITRALLERSDNRHGARRRFRSAHWLRLGVGNALFVLCAVLMVVLTAVGVVPTLAGVGILVLLAWMAVTVWRRSLGEPVAAIFALDGSRLTVLKWGFRPMRLELSEIDRAAYIGQPPGQRYNGLGLLVVPSQLGRRWEYSAGPVDGPVAQECATIAAWPSALTIEYDRMWRDEVVLPVARQLVLAGAHMTPRLRAEVRDTVLQAAALAARRQSGDNLLKRWARVVVIRRFSAPRPSRGSRARDR